MRHRRDWPRRYRASDLDDRSRLAHCRRSRVGKATWSASLPMQIGRSAETARTKVEMTVTILIGHVLDKLRELPDESVHCCVTSPPYWGAQRDYGHPGQIGMEKTPEEYIAALLGVFREVDRVLRGDGVCWIVIGDSYAASGKGGGGSMMIARGHQWGHRAHLKGWRSPPPGYKQKDLVGVPWMLATALRSDGWTLRRDVVWDKGSATEPTRSDRPSGSHEYIFLLSRGIRY